MFAIIDEPDKGLLSVMVGLILLVGLLVFREGDTSFRKITYWAILPIAILLLLYLSDGAMSFVKSYDYLVSLLGFLYTTLIPWLARDLRS